MRVQGGARSAAVRGPKVRLRGLSEIATNRWLFLFVLGLAPDRAAWRCSPQVVYNYPQLVIEGCHDRQDRQY